MDRGKGAIMRRTETIVTKIYQDQVTALIPLKAKGERAQFIRDALDKAIAEKLEAAQ